MLITLSRRAAIWQSVTPLGAVSHRLFLFFIIIISYILFFNIFFEKNCPVAWSRAGVIIYWSRGPEHDSRLWSWIFSKLENMSLPLRTGLFCVLLPLSMFGPMLSLEKAAALCWSKIRRGIPDVFVFIYVVHRKSCTPDTTISGLKDSWRE